MGGTDNEKRRAGPAIHIGNWDTRQVQFFSRHAGRLYFALVAVFLGGLGSATPTLAIVVGELDDFQGGTSESWRTGLAMVSVVADAGPGGSGDFALFIDTAVHCCGKLVVINTDQWLGDWTGAGVTQISVDVRNPTASSLTMRIGIAGPGGVFAGGGGDVYITPGIVVPPDDQWHTITFDVLASDFISVGGADIDAALTDVTHVRIFSSAAAIFTGQSTGAMYLDNIQALGASMMLDGDYNGDDVVNAADYVLWRKDPSAFGGDAQGYNDWRTNFGAASGGGSVAGLTAHGVPEPASLWLPMAAFSFFAGARPARRGKGDC